MSYRARRNPARQAVAERPENTSHLQQPREQIARPTNGSENDFSEESRFRNNNNQHSTSILPKFNNDQRRNKVLHSTDKTRSIQPAETRIPVPKRVAQRVPNNYKEEERVTPVRERFRARRLDDETANTKEHPRSKTNVSKRVTFYRNGDKHFKGRSLFITKQRYRSFDSLLEDLSRVIPLPYGVRNVFSTDGQLISSMNELEDGSRYVCSSGDQLIRNIDYTDKAKTKLINEGPCEGIQNISLSDTSSNSSSTRSKNATKPKIITIINQERSLKCKILLNRKTVKNYEDILHDVSEMMKLRGEHVHELYNEHGNKVGGLSEMFYGGDAYSAGIAADVSSTKRNLSNPSSHSSNGLDEPLHDRKQHKSRKKQRRDANADEEGVAIKVKGKKLVFYPPSKRNKQLDDDDELLSAPSSQPQLYWVYGYQGRDSHHNLHVLPSGEILYFVSRVVVIYNRQTNTQRHYTGHADDIKSMAVHPNQWYIATGQASGLSLDHNELSHIRIWDSETLLTLNVLQLDDYTLSVVAMAFSMEDNGDVLSCIDSSGDSFRLNIWEWKDNKCLVQSKNFVTPVSVVMFDPDDNKTIMSCGREHVYFWRWHNGKLERKNGLFENNPLPQYITCLDFASNGDLFTGDSNGSITAWSKVSKKVKFMVRNAHEKTILCLCILDSGLLLTAGGVDGRICAWDANKYFSTPLHEIQLPELAGICALDPLHSGDSSDVTLIVGTTANSIIEGSFTGPITTIVKGHKSEVPSFAVHPSRDVFVTASLDETAILWSAVNNEIIWTVNVEFAIQVAAFYTTGSVIAFGTTQGRWIILNAESGMHQASFQDGSEAITDIEYSPDGEHIAVGSKDGNIYIHAVYDDGMTYRRVGCCSGHTTPVMFLDWSVDGCFVQSMSTEYDIITWEIGAFEREISQNVIRDTEWNTRNVVLGYDVVGVWRSTPTEGNLVTSCDLAWSHNLIAIGDELGYLRVFNYPCCYDESQYHQVRAHSATVLRVMFFSSDKFLLTTAGQDCAVLQWRMEGRMTPATKRTKNLHASLPKHVLSTSDGQTGIDQGRRANSPPIDDHSNRATKQDKPWQEHDTHDTEIFSDSGDFTAAHTSDEFSKEEQETQSRTNGSQRNDGLQDRQRNDGLQDRQRNDGVQDRQRNDGLQDRRRGRRNHFKPRRSFEQDMYQDRDETSDERKMKILRHGRASKRNDHHGDESTDDDMYDDDEIDRRQTLKPKESYSRVKNNRRRVDARAVDVEVARKPNDAPASYSHGKQDGYAGRRGYARNKR